MNETDAEKLAHGLMREHGLLEAGWRFAWSHGKRQLGAAHVSDAPDGSKRKTLKLSRHLVRLNAEPVVRDVILHEIAHALVGVEQGHNRRWIETCRRIGANPQRLAGPEVVVPVPPWALTCAGCHAVVARRYRRVAPDRLKRLCCRRCGPVVGRLSLSLQPV